ncbi:MAG: hypothetical protein ABI314_00470 [Gemmatimonadaceae bacterium]
MYSTCLFCHAALGANQVVEHFPVGRRLAFDGERGRLWVVCRSCERWNLTPLEERWEAIEECERLFRDTKQRMSTEHIGLARVSEGLELVRVGNPQRPEMAAWRYGDQFGRRRKRHYMIAGGTFVVAGALVSGYAALGLIAGGGSVALNVASTSYRLVRNRRIVARVPTPDGVIDITQALLPKARIVRLDDSDWQLALECRGSKPNGGARRWFDYESRGFARPRTVNLTSRDALPALAALLPRVNGSGGSRRHVETAVRMLEESGGATNMASVAASLAMKPRWNAMKQGRLSAVPVEVRLALEMATHEADERRALEGELATLEERWKEAEEIAQISDNMFLPQSITDWLQKVRA